MKPHRLHRCRILAGACVVVLACVAPAAAQFPPPPGQANPGQANPNQSNPGQARSGSVFPPPPGAQQQGAFPPPPGAQQSSAFPPVQGQAPAQASAPVPGGFSAGAAPGGFAAPPGGAPQPTEAQKVCLTFPALREDVEKGAAQIKAASDRKAAREEVCPLFKSFALREAKMVKFLETNRVLCGVPAQIIPQIKGNHAKTIQIRNAVCSAAPAGGGGGVAAPTLSDALGGPTIADDTSSRQPGRGTFDTLTGNALQR